VAVATLLNYLLFRFYHSKVSGVCSKLESLSSKIDKMMENYECRISKLEESVKWLVDLTKK